MSTTPNFKALGLHEGANGTLCGCGPCQHRIRQIAGRLGITPAALAVRLKAAPKPKQQARRGRIRNGGQVAERVTVTLADGTRYTGPAAILAAVHRVHT